MACGEDEVKTTQRKRRKREGQRTALVQGRSSRRASSIASSAPMMASALPVSLRLAAFAAAAAPDCAAASSSRMRGLATSLIAGLSMDTPCEEPCL
jgi:hypothetical protein